MTVLKLSFLVLCLWNKESRDSMRSPKRLILWHLYSPLLEFINLVLEELFLSPP